MFRKKLKAYQSIFGTEEGKLVLVDLFKFCGLNQPSFVEKSSHKTAFNEGAKYVANYIKNNINYSIADVDKIIKDYKDHNSNNKKISNDRK